MTAQSINELCQCVVQCVDQCMSQGHDPGDLLMPPFSMNISGPRAMRQNLLHQRSVEITSV